MANGMGWGYPAGAVNDPNAPWNQDEPEVRDVPVLAISTWHRNDDVECELKTDYDEDGGYCYPDTRNLIDTFSEQHMSMLELLEKFRSLLNERIDNGINVSESKRLIKEIDAWDEVDFEVEEC